MKLAFGFLTGVLACCLLLFGVQVVAPIFAQTEDNTSSDNFSLVKLIPNFEKIYKDALAMPFQEAEKKIYDDDIARFYHLLMGKTALNKGSEE
ncbi:MAG: hypothetical protein PHR56_07185 [Dehalococcoidales bacterium]|nr:hypothetical protein [Dehalococcoidales bacterium]